MAFQPAPEFQISASQYQAMSPTQQKQWMTDSGMIAASERGEAIDFKMGTQPSPQAAARYGSTPGAQQAGATGKPPSAAGIGQALSKVGGDSGGAQAATGGAGAGAGAAVLGNSGGAVAAPQIVSVTGVNAAGGAPVAGAPVAGAPIAAPLAIGAVMGNNLYEGGVKDMIKGNAKKDDYANTVANANPYTASANVILRTMGQKSIGKMLTSGKSEEQGKRDDVRSALQKLGIIDDKYVSTNPNGAKLNYGVDGKAKAEYGTRADGSALRPYELPDTTTDEVLHHTVGWAQPLSALLSGGDEKTSVSTTGYLVKDAMGGKGDLETSRTNLLSQFQKLGITPEQAKAEIDKMNIDPQRKAAYKHGLDELVSGSYFSNELARFKAQQAGQSLPDGILMNGQVATGSGGAFKPVSGAVSASPTLNPGIQASLPTKTPPVAITGPVSSTPIPGPIYFNPTTGTITNQKDPTGRPGGVPGDAISPAIKDAMNRQVPYTNGPVPSINLTEEQRKKLLNGGVQHYR